MNGKIYLDNNGTTPLDPNVLDVMIEELANGPRNPSSIHTFGQEGKKILTKARKTIADFFSLKPSDILFTSGGTEGLNLLIRGTSKGGHIIGSNIDHAAVYSTLEDLKEKGAVPQHLKVELLLFVFLLDKLQFFMQFQM